MSNKGLCGTCFFEKKCDLPKKFPVWNCEEFRSEEFKQATKKGAKKK
jgi:hypothetical protein